MKFEELPDFERHNIRYALMGGFVKFINHEPKPFNPMIDKVMKL